MQTTIYTILIPAVFTLLGVLLGHYLNHVSSYNLYKKQHLYENQRLSYAKLMSLKNPWTQVYRTHIEAKLLSEYYHVMFVQFSQQEHDLVESKRQYDRALGLIPEISNIQREVFETLALIQTCFKMTSSLQKAIDDLYNYETVDVGRFPFNFANPKKLQEKLDLEMSHIEPILHKQYKEKIDNISSVLNIFFCTKK